MATATLDRLLVRIDGDITALRRELRNATTAVEGFGSKTDRAAKKGERSIGRLSRSMTAMRAAARAATAGIVALGAALAVRSIATATLQMDRITNSLKAATGSSKLAAAEFGFVTDQAKRLGLDLGTAAEGYAKLTAAARGTALEGQATRDIFLSIVETMAALGRSSEETEGAIRAIEQMISKGNVSAEELRGQLGERLPGAFQVAARAMGVTTVELNKMLEQGELLATDLLPRLARELRNDYAGAAQEASTKLRAAINRLSTAWLEFRTAIADSGTGEMMARALDLAARMVEWLTEKVRLAEPVVTGFLKRMGLLAKGPEDLKAKLAELTGEAARLSVEIEKLESERGGGSPRPGTTRRMAVLKKELQSVQQEIAATSAAITDLSSGPLKLTITQPIDPGNFNDFGIDRERLAKIMKPFEEMKRAAGEQLADWHERYLQLTLSETEFTIHEYERRLEALRKMQESGLVSAEDAARARVDLERSKAEEIAEINRRETEKQVRDQQEAVGRISELADRMIESWEDGWRGLARVALGALESIIKKQLELNAATQGGGSGGGGGGLFGSLFGAIGKGFMGAFGGGGGGGAPLAGGGTSFDFIPKFATGGSFNVGGSGGTDSQLVAFRATPNEQVTVRTPSQVARGIMPGGGGGGAPIVIHQTLQIGAGVQGTVRAELRAAMPEIEARTKAAVADQVQRGGRFAKAFGK